MATTNWQSESDNSVVQRLTDLLQEYLTIEKVTRDMMLAELAPEKKFEILSLEADFHLDIIDMKFKMREVDVLSPPLDLLIKRPETPANSPAVPSSSGELTVNSEYSDIKCKLPGGEKPLNKIIKGINGESTKRKMNDSTEPIQVDKKLRIDQSPKATASQEKQLSTKAGTLRVQKTYAKTPRNFDQVAEGILGLSGRSSQSDFDGNPCFTMCVAALCRGDPLKWTRSDLDQVLRDGFGAYEKILRADRGYRIDQSLLLEDAALINNKMVSGNRIYKFDFEGMFIGRIAGDQVRDDCANDLSTNLHRIFESTNAAIILADGKWLAFFKSNEFYFYFNSHSTALTGEIAFGAPAMVFGSKDLEKIIEIVAAGVGGPHTEYQLHGVVIKQ